MAAMRFSPDVEAAILAAAQRAGVSPDLLRTFATIESGGRADVRTGSYKGLFQLSDQEFARHGGQGNIFDPQANANAAANKIRDESTSFESRMGRPPSAAELYVIHQQGTAGSEAHRSNPDAPAWQNMRNTGEGRAKGDTWARAAIWGNVPDDMKAQYGSVDNITSHQFTDMWAQKVERMSGGNTSQPRVAGAQAQPTLPMVPQPSQSASAAPQDSGNGTPAPPANILSILGAKLAGGKDNSAEKPTPIDLTEEPMIRLLDLFPRRRVASTFNMGS